MRTGFKVIVFCDFDNSFSEEFSFFILNLIYETILLVLFKLFIVLLINVTINRSFAKKRKKKVHSTI